MSDGIRLIKTSDTITERLNLIIKKGKDPRAFLSRVAYPLYQSHQMKRWMTEGESEGETWPRINKEYELYKKKKFSSYPGSGTKMLIARGNLFESVVGKHLGDSDPKEGSMSSIGGIKGHNVVFADKSMTISTELQFAKYVNETRKMFKFRDQFRKEIRNKYANWIMKAG